MKTVSKGVLVLTAAAIGGDLIFEAEPLDTTVYNKVSEGASGMLLLPVEDTVYCSSYLNYFFFSLYNINIITTTTSIINTLHNHLQLLLLLLLRWRRKLCLNTRYRKLYIRKVGT